MQEMISQVIASLPSGYSRKQKQGGNGRHRQHDENQHHTNTLASGDIVELSLSAPRAFTSEELAAVFALGERLCRGREIAREEIIQLQVERTLAAVLAMELVAADSSAAAGLWPEGIPGCSAKEFESAYQRLVQHISRESAQIKQDIELRRRDLVEAYRSADFSLLAEKFAR